MREIREEVNLDISSTGWWACSPIRAGPRSSSSTAPGWSTPCRTRARRPKTWTSSPRGHPLGRPGLPQHPRRPQGVPPRKDLPTHACGRMHCSLERHLDATHHCEDHHGHPIPLRPISCAPSSKRTSKRQERRPGLHPFPPGTQRIPAYRPRQVHLPEFRSGPRLRRRLPPAFRRYQPWQGGPGLRGLHQGRRALARLRLGRHLYHASDYFERLYQFAEELIVKGKAYVCSLSAEDVREYRGTLTEPGKNSPYRERSVEENLDLFRRMRAGEFPEGAHILRAKIDMASPNMNMRDPALYRILHQEHQNTGKRGASTPCTISPTACRTPWSTSPTPSAPWNSRTTSPSTTGFWTSSTSPADPVQYEFNRLNINYTVTSKRKLKTLVDNGVVARLERPAHAHHLGPAPPRFPARGHPRLLRTRRGEPLGQLRGHGRPRKLRAAKIWTRPPRSHGRAAAPSA